MLQGLASNYTVDGKKLKPKLRSPFREHFDMGGHPEWLSGLYDVRTEIAQTFELLHMAHAMMQHAV